MCISGACATIYRHFGERRIYLVEMDVNSCADEMMHLHLWCKFRIYALMKTKVARVKKIST